MTRKTKAKLLVAPDGDELILNLMAELKALDEVWLETFPSLDAAVRSCRYLDPPDAALTVVTHQAPGVLELMVALNSSSPTVPLFAIVSAETFRELPFETHPSFTLLSADSPAEELLEQLTSTIKISTSVARPRRGIDFLLAAVLSERSITLDLKVADVEEVHIECVGGDIWNVYAGGSNNQEALAAVLPQIAEEIEVRALQTIPGERQISQTGLEILSRSFEDSPESQVPRAFSSEFESVETLEIEVAAVRAEFIAAQQSKANQTSDKSLSKKPSKNGYPSNKNNHDQDPFNTLLAEGIQAALSRDYQKAAKTFEQALVLRPGNTTAEFNLGRVRRQLGAE